jgi:hypothetical protein
MAAAGGAEADELAKLHAKYADDSDECNTELSHEAAVPPLFKDSQAINDTSASNWQQQQQSSDSPAEPLQAEQWSDYDEDEYASSDEEDDEEVYAALEWADDREGPSVPLPVTACTVLGTSNL